MVKLKINNIPVEVEEGTTILDAAGKAGVHIPTMCFLKGYEPSTSCMVCVVEAKGKSNLIPACGAMALEAMDVVTDSQRVLTARKRAVELLLSDHVGDCIGPCESGCPANMNIPLMIRQIIRGDLEDAISTVKKDIPLPATLGRICPAPCEKACRRAAYDQAVSICLLKRYVGDLDLASGSSYMPDCRKPSGKKVAVIGAGPAGLSAAYYLTQNGHKCTVFDDHPKPGGMLSYGVTSDILSPDVLDAEIELIRKLGVELKLSTAVGVDITFDRLRVDFDAVFIAAGVNGPKTEYPAVEMNSDVVKVDKQTYATSLDGVFAGGDVTGKRQLAIRAIADGKQAAYAIDKFLSGSDSLVWPKRFTSRMGKCQPDEIETFVRLASDQPRLLPEEPGDPFTPMQVLAESKRCLHCDCRKPDNCKLRDLAEKFDARSAKYRSDRKRFLQYAEHADIIFEPGKCIDCGLCIQIAANDAEKLGLTFVNRGFDVRVGVPFGGQISQALVTTAAKCVKACPTGAIAFKNEQ